jgi:hypothetical protein
MDLRPLADEYAPYFERYIALVPEADALPILGTQAGILAGLSSSLPAAMEQFRYAEGKWTIREVFGHLIDAERVFGYRSFCISRGESAPLPAFDEDTYVARSGYDGRNVAELVREFSFVRQSNLAFLSALTPEQWLQRGTASGKTISVRALPFIMAGHVRHHLRILQERYGVPKT